MNDARNNLEAAIALADLYHHPEFKALEQERDEYLNLAGERNERNVELRKQLENEISRAEALQTELDAQINANLMQTHEYFADKWAFETRINNLEITNRALVEAANKVGADLDFWQAEALEWAKSFGAMRQAWERSDRIKEKLKTSLERAQWAALVWCVLACVNWLMIGLYLWANRG
jgi:HAMP domain-containing protein